ncbi:hypothetical protein GGR51DRAFT_513003 [Nemania sp. FL0031]|nr:hypothetical protein GGR51DRAFT_513003 [Nemania sp. FL0031]
MTCILTLLGELWPSLKIVLAYRCLMVVYPAEHPPQVTKASSATIASRPATRGSRSPPLSYFLFPICDCHVPWRERYNPATFPKKRARKSIVASTSRKRANERSPGGIQRRSGGDEICMV